MTHQRWRASVLCLVCVAVLSSCQAQATPTLDARPTPRTGPSPTFTLPFVTPEPGHTLAVRAYLRAVHSRVLLEYARRTAANRNLLADAQSMGMDADMLCADEGEAQWHHMADLIDETGAIAAPTGCTEFRQLLLDSLEGAETTAQSHGWLCETYAVFGQPAEGMWAKMIQQVRSCQVRSEQLHEHWRSLGGDELGLLW